MKTFSVFKTLCILLLLVVIACSPLHKYKISAQSWEKDIQKFEKLDSMETYPDDAILFMGSSSIRLWNSLIEDMKPYHAIQRGFGGARISDLAWYTPRIAYPHKCQAIVIFIANDITGSETDKTPAEVSALFKNIVQTIRKKMPETPIFYIQVTPTESRWKVWPLIQQGNELVRKQCQILSHTYFIETEKNFLNEEGMPKNELFMGDRLHLNPEGYKIWTQVIKQNLNSVLKK